jgi:chemotaxis protein methyltransferase CheR
MFATATMPTARDTMAPAKTELRLAADQEFELTAADFDCIRGLIFQHAGISLNAGKQAMVYSRLSRRLRDTGHKSFASYLGWLQGAAPGSEWQEFINCLTTNLTAFFREEHHFLALAEELRARAVQPLRVWCNAASTGEEPYSLAMTVAETWGAAAPVKLVCSDIDTQVLAQAERGVYAADARGLTPGRLRQHFMRGTGSNSGFIRIKPELQKLCEFRRFNLMGDDWHTLGQAFDIVFCRNVMIYFDAPTQRQVLQGIHQVMRPGGLLYVGHSENFGEARELFRLRGKTVYERV